MRFPYRTICAKPFQIFIFAMAIYATQVTVHFKFNMRPVIAKISYLSFQIIPWKALYGTTAPKKDDVYRIIVWITVLVAIFQRSRYQWRLIASMFKVHYLVCVGHVYSEPPRNISKYHQISKVLLFLVSFSIIILLFSAGISVLTLQEQ